MPTAKRILVREYESGTANSSCPAACVGAHPTTAISGSDTRTLRKDYHYHALSPPTKSANSDYGEEDSDDEIGAMVYRSSNTAKERSAAAALVIDNALSVSYHPSAVSVSMNDDDCKRSLAVKSAAAALVIDNALSVSYHPSAVSVSMNDDDCKRSLAVKSAAAAVVIDNALSVSPIILVPHRYP